MQLTMSKAKFLANKTNKQQFIKMLGDQLEMTNRKVHHAPGDADLLIVQKSDTDRLVLLCYHSSLHSHRVLVPTRGKEEHKESARVEHPGCQGTARS